MLLAASASAVLPDPKIRGRPLKVCSPEQPGQTPWFFTGGGSVSGAKQQQDWAAAALCPPPGPCYRATSLSFPSARGWHWPLAEQWDQGGRLPSNIREPHEAGQHAGQGAQVETRGLCSGLGCPHGHLPVSCLDALPSPSQLHANSQHPVALSESLPPSGSRKQGCWAVCHGEDRCF